MLITDWIPKCNGAWVFTVPVEDEPPQRIQAPLLPTQAKTQSRSTQHAYEGKHTRNPRNKTRPRPMQQEET
jgi:hypothetical protein